MEIQFQGAARSVTGSRFLLRVGARRVLLECGLFQGPRDLSETRNRSFAFDPASIDGVVLSHAHIDHSGNLPSLWKRGYRGRIHATAATVDLCRVMLPDSAHIQQKDVEFVNRRESRRGTRRREPLYTLKDAEGTQECFEPHPYGERFEVCGGVSARFLDAGHILGSAIVELDLKERGSHRRFVFTGDLGRCHLPILRDPAPMPPCDVLMIESTYGNRHHLSPQETPEALAKVIERVAARSGKILVPAFAVGRVQEISSILKGLIERGRIPALPVYVDSPLAVDATEVFRRHPECYDAEARQILEQGGDPFGFGLIRYIRDVEDSIALNGRTDSMIIVSPSGMCEAGRILHHLRNNIGDPRNLVLIVGFQADSTLGKRLVEKRDRVRIFGEEFERRAEVVVMNGMSAHADRGELLDWAANAERRPATTFVVHGAEDQSLSLAEALRERGLRKVEVPELGQEASL